MSEAAILARALIIIWVAFSIAHILGAWTIMASLLEVQDSLTALHADVEDLKSRLPAPAAATVEDLDALKASIDAERANVQSILA